MSAAWLDKPDNPGMVDWAVGSEDVYAAVVLVSFHDSAFKAALTADLESWLPVTESRQLDDLEWATQRPASAASPRNSCRPTSAGYEAGAPVVRSGSADGRIAKRQDYAAG